jgi:hypothetical protein
VGFSSIWIFFDPGSLKVLEVYSGVPIKMSFLKSQRENFQDYQL